MIRAVAKGSVMWVFGRVPGGVRVYRFLTRKAMGTQATHVDKLARVWPGYVKVWRERCGVDLAGKRIWIHDGGWTVFPFLAAHMATGHGAVVTNDEAQVLDRYTRHALEEAVELQFGPTDLACNLLRAGVSDAATVIARTAGRLIRDESEVEDASIDLVHSGGTLEHYAPDKLREFAAQCYRVLAPGGVASHVFDHRDHLYHADKRYPFLNHLRFHESAYRFLCGHRLLYHNRLLPAEVVGTFEAAGFETIAVRRLALPSKTYHDNDMPPDALVGLERSKLAKRYRGATDADLRTAAAHYLFRRR